MGGELIKLSGEGFGRPGDHARVRFCQPNTNQCQDALDVRVVSDRTITAKVPALCNLCSHRPVVHVALPTPVTETSSNEVGFEYT